MASVLESCCVNEGRAQAPGRTAATFPTESLQSRPSLMTKLEKKLFPIKLLPYLLPKSS